MRQPRTIKPQPQKLFEGFPYSSRVLKVFYYSKRANEFILSTGKRDGIIFFKTEKVTAFKNWLRDNDVCDFNAQLEKMGIEANI